MRLYIQRIPDQVKFRDAFWILSAQSNWNDSSHTARLKSFANMKYLPHIHVGHDF